MNAASGAEARTIVLIGATSGLGRASALQLGAAGHRLILVGRDRGRGMSLTAQITARAPGNRRPVFIAGDISTRDGVAAVAERIKDETDAVDTLLNNAGVMSSRRVLTEEGMELNFAVHHLAPFTMTGLLLPLLARGEGRIVNTNSEGHRAALFGAGEIRLDFDDLQSERRYNPYLAYSRSKLANLLFTFEFHRRYAGFPIAAVHPGMVRTRLVRSMHRPGFWLLSTATRWMLMSPDKGGQALTELATTPVLDSGGYYDRTRLAKASPHANSRADAELLWDVSEVLRGPFTASADRRMRPDAR